LQLFIALLFSDPILLSKEALSTHRLIDSHTMQKKRRRDEGTAGL
jgi:hypothetical protein